MADNKPAAVAADKPTAQTTAPKAKLSVRFTAPAYRGKADGGGVIQRPNVADAIISGVFGTLPLVLTGFTLQNNNGQIAVFMPKSGPIQSAPPAVQPAMIPAPEGVETETGMVLAPGARGAVEKLHDAIRDAWARANATGATKFGESFDLAV